MPFLSAILQPNSVTDPDLVKKEMVKICNDAHTKSKTGAINSEVVDFDSEGTKSSRYYYKMSHSWA